MFKPSQKMEIGGNIKRFRKKAGLSQLQVGERISLGGSYISLIETGQQYPSIDNLIELGKLFDVPISELIGEKRISEVFENMESRKAFLSKFEDIKYLDEKDQGIVLSIVERLKDKD